MKDERRGNENRERFNGNKRIVHRPSSIVSHSQGQSILEYTILLGVIVMVMFAMGPMLKRGTQSLIKIVADQVGVQQNAEQQSDATTGHLEAIDAAVLSFTDKQTFDTVGTISYVFNDVATTTSNASVDLGFTEGR